MSTQTDERRMPTRVREFRSAAATVNVKKWEETDDRPASFFLELSQATNRVDPVTKKTIWVNLQIQTADAPGLADALQRAAAFANSKEDAAFR